VTRRGWLSAAGVAAAFGYCLAVGYGLRSSFLTTYLAAAVAVALAVAGRWLLRRLPHRDLGGLIAVVAVVAVVAQGAGTVASATLNVDTAMELHKLVVGWAAAFAGVLGVALGLADDVHRETERVGLRVRDLADGSRSAGLRVAGRSRVRRLSDEPRIREFARLDAQIRETADQLAAAQTRERAAQAALREHINHSAHDLRTPLAGMRVMVQALLDGMVPETEIRDTLMLVDQEIEQLARLTDDLAEVSRVTSGQMRLRTVPADIAAAVADVLAVAAPVAARAQVRLVGRTVGRPPQVDLAVPEFVRVVRNVVGNALRETVPGGCVTVETGPTGDGGAFVSVTDECGGIPDETLPRVFDSGFRGDEARTTTRDSGFGYGLAIARGIVAAHGGTIAVCNVAGGCRFEIRIPAPAIAASQPVAVQVDGDNARSALA
jgi:signal transduction histidine kinase